MAAIAAVLAAKERIAERDQDPSENTQHHKLNRVSTFNRVKRGTSHTLFERVTSINGQDFEEIGPSSPGSDKVSGGLSSAHVSSYVHQMPDARKQRWGMLGGSNPSYFHSGMCRSLLVLSTLQTVSTKHVIIYSVDLLSVGRRFLTRRL